MSVAYLHGGRTQRPLYCLTPQLCVLLWASFIESVNSVNIAFGFAAHHRAGNEIAFAELYAQTTNVSNSLSAGSQKKPHEHRNTSQYDGAWWGEDHDAVTYRASSKDEEDVLRVVVRSDGQPLRQSSQQQPFVRVLDEHSAPEETIVEVVEVPSATSIGSFYIMLYLPILVCWVFHYAVQDSPLSSMFLLSMTLCAMIVCQDLANQVLSILMGAPNAITAIQATCMGVFVGIWSFIHDDKLRGEDWDKLRMWMIVVVFFVIYQIVNHLVSFYCSLSERVIFTNLCPVLTLLFETTVMPAQLRTNPSMQIKMALAFMVLGAAVYSAGTSLTTTGLAIASSLIVLIVPYRLVQRYVLAEVKELPCALLASIDGLCLSAVVTPISVVDQTDFAAAIVGWVADGQILPILILSVLAFGGTHVCGLLMLKVGSATNYLVFHNFANFMVVLIGIVMFKDEVTLYSLTGLALSLCGGVWYALESSRQMAELQPKSIDEHTKPAAEEVLCSGETGGT